MGVQKMKVKHLRQYLNLLPSDFDDKEVRFVYNDTIYVMGKYVEPVDENNPVFLDMRVE